MKIAAPQTIDAYLAALPPDQRAALDKLRQQILAIAPTAEECLSYGQPAFRLHGRLLVALGADGEHCTLHPLSASWIKVHHADLKGYPTSKGVIRFRADKPLPVALVRKLVKERVAQNAAKEAAAATALRLAAKRPPLIEEPQIVETEAQLTAFIHVTVPRAEIGRALDAGLRELSDALRSQGIPPTGPWFTHHLRRPSDTFDLEIGLPVGAPVAPAGRVQPGEARATRVARTVYRGPYEGLGAAWGELLAWIEAGGHAQAEDLWERPLSGPESGADPGTWRTQLDRPLVG
jgi:uncharacterized protein YdhG (YjbR/CyaY superfamily)/effector-binding domain-containing protein